MCVTGAFVDVAAAVGNGAMVSRETSLCWCPIVGTSPAEAGAAGEAAGPWRAPSRQRIPSRRLAVPRCRAQSVQRRFLPDRPQWSADAFELRDGKARGASIVSVSSVRLMARDCPSMLMRRASWPSRWQRRWHPQDDACFLVHYLSRSLALSSHASGAEFGQMVFLAMLDDQAGLRQVIERA